MTLPETRVWFWLRRHSLGGFKFRRQHPVGRFVLDFYRPELRLAIEVDGIGHDQPVQVRHDELRSRELSSEGIVVVRLRNEIVLENPDGAWEMIAAAVARMVAVRENRPESEVLRILVADV